MKLGVENGGGFMLRIILVLAVILGGCTGTEEVCTDTERVVTDTLTVVKRDTVKVIQKDTVKIRDTVRVVQRDTVFKVDTVFKRDTIVIRDTVKILANVSAKDDLFGTWDGVSGSQKVTIAFTSSIIHEADFSASLGGSSGNGYINVLENGQAKVTHAGFKDVTWLLSLDRGVLTIEEIGVKFFGGQTTTLKKR